MENSVFGSTYESLQQHVIELKKAALKESAVSGDILSETFELLHVTLDALQTAEDKLQRQQEKNRHYERLLESVTDYVYTVQVEHDQPMTTIHGPGCIAITGFSPQDYETDPDLWYRMIYQEDRSTVMAQVTSLLTGQAVSPLEHRLIHQDGSTRWVQSTLVPRYDEQERLVAYSGLLTNITKRKQVEADLRQSVATNRALVEAIPDLIFRLRRDGTYLEVIPARDMVTLKPPDEMIGKNVTEILPPDLTQQRLHYIEQALKTGEIQSYEFQLSLQGELHQQEARIVPIGQDEVIVLIRDITRRKRSEQALRESELKFRTLAETTSAAIFIFQGSRLCYVNHAASTITGYDQAQLLSMNFWEVMHPDFQEIVKEDGLARQRRLESRPNWVEEKVLTKGGEERWVRANLGQIEYQGQAAILGTAFDITGLKQTRAELERLLVEEREQRLIAQVLGDVFLTLSAQTSYPAVLDEILRQARRLVSYSAANIMLLDGYVLRTTRAQGYENFGTKAWIATLEQSLSDLPLDYGVVKSRRPLVVPDTWQDSAWVVEPASAWIRSFIAVPINLQDKVLGLLRLDSNVPHNFSERDLYLLCPLANAAAIVLENARLYDQARRELIKREKVEKVLRQTVTRKQAIVNAIPDSLFYLNQKGEILDYKLVDPLDGNDFLLADLGHLAIGSDLNEMLPPDVAALTLNLVKQTLETGQCQIFEFQLPASAGIQDFEARLVATGTDEVLAVVRNITKRRKAERQASRTERLAALGKLAATLAHEINNPLQAIQSHLDLILNYPLEPANIEQYLRKINHHLDRINELTRQILNLARPQPAQREQIEVAEIVQDVLVLVAKTLETKQIEVTVNVQEAPQVVAAPDQLAQVFLNLIINAIEAVADKGQLFIEIYPVGAEVAISFTNNGPAIPPDILPHIFDPFFTTKAEGSGLGLWVSHNLIEQHAGSLTVDNITPEQGVVFTAKLPMTRGDELKQFS